MDEVLISLIPILAGWILDLIFGDPACLPHPVVGFGKIISKLERKLNVGTHRILKGGILSIGLIAGVYIISWCLLSWLSDCMIVKLIVESILIFYCLAGHTLRKEVSAVFAASSRSLEEGRHQVARVVGRDTHNLSLQEVRCAGLETLSENLSDGVVAPLFWYVILGLPGMLAYKMINTLDSMIGYRSDRYLKFGKIAAKIDDAANFLPARITALLMILCAAKPLAFNTVFKYGRAHLSPNSGYPEAALAGILEGRFGGPHDYFGINVDKPFIGDKEKVFGENDLKKAISINWRVEIIAILITLMIRFLTHC